MAIPAGRIENELGGQHIPQEVVGEGALSTDHKVLIFKPRAAEKVISFRQPITEATFLEWFDGEMLDMREKELDLSKAPRLDLPYGKKILDVAAMIAQKS